MTVVRSTSNAIASHFQEHIRHPLILYKLISNVQTILSCKSSLWLDTIANLSQLSVEIKEIYDS